MKNKVEVLILKNTFTAVFEKVGKWYLGFVEEVPGANTQGKTLKETRKNLKEAVRLILSSNRKLIKTELSGKKFIKEEFKIAI